jgi:hypothetical protein
MHTGIIDITLLVACYFDLSQPSRAILDYDYAFPPQDQQNMYQM